MTPPSPLARLVAAVEAVGLTPVEGEVKAVLTAKEWKRIYDAAQAAWPVEGAEKARADAAWTELEDCRSYVAEIAQGVSHYPHDAGEPCVRCERDALKLATTPTDADVEAVVKALEEMLALIDEGWLVRNTTNDGHFPSYLRESVRLVKAIADSQAALAELRARREA
jgi:methylphosphotriester-DNA--protein-cysteine methyltransferase